MQLLGTLLVFIWSGTVFNSDHPHVPEKFTSKHDTTGLFWYLFPASGIQRYTTLPMKRVPVSDHDKQKKFHGQSWVEQAEEALGQ